MPVDRQCHDNPNLRFLVYQSIDNLALLGRFTCAGSGPAAALLRREANRPRPRERRGPRVGSAAIWPGGFLHDLTLSQDDQRLITVPDSNDRPGNDRDIVIWDLKTERPLHRLPHRWVSRIALSA